MSRQVRFLDLRVTDPEERAKLLQAVEGVLDHGRIINGPEVDAIENAVAERCGRRYAVGVNSGTDALFLALKALGIRAGDEVITTSLSWIASANAIRLTGATPVFADIRDDLNLDPASVRRLITPRTRAVVPVHYTGKMCAMDELAAICEEHKLLLVEDAAQSFDATYAGRKAGTFGVLGCFSMNSMKVFASIGEAGVVVTDDPELRERLIALRYNGTVNREVCIEPCLNARMDTIQAAVLLKRLPALAALIGRRQEIARRYSRLLEGVVGTPAETPEQSDVYYTYTIRAERRDELKAFLEERGIEVKIQHPILMPDQPAYEGSRAETENARRLVQQILCIPANEKITDDEVDYVAATIREFYAA